MRDVTPIPKRKRPKRSKTMVGTLSKRADKLWGELIHERDRACQFCGKADGKLDAHHILPRTFKATRWTPENGILLCFRCHQDVAHGDSFAAVTHYDRILGAERYRMLREQAYAGQKLTVDHMRDVVDGLERRLQRRAA